MRVAIAAVITALLAWSAFGQVGPIPGFAPSLLIQPSTMAVFATWNPATVTNGGVLSSGNLSFQFSGSSGNVARGSKGTSSKVYYEMTITTCNCGAGYFGFGVIDDSQATATPNSVATVTAKMWEWRDDDFKINNGSNTSYGSGFSQSSIQAVAIDNSLGSGSGKVWWGTCSGGTVSWFSSGNPATGANPAYSNLTGTIKAFINFFGSNGSPKGLANFGATSYSCTPPSGFGNF